jgi:hypothetical protein
MGSGGLSGQQYQQQNSRAASTSSTTSASTGGEATAMACDNCGTKLSFFRGKVGVDQEGLK